MFPDHHLPEDQMKEVLSSDRAAELIIGGYVHLTAGQLILWNGKLKRYVVPLSDFESLGTGVEPDFEDFEVIDWGNTIRFGKYEAAVDALELIYMPNGGTMPVNDPIHKEDDGWYFWNETWADRQGPFETEEEARATLRRYCNWLDGKLPGQQKV